MKWLNCQFRKKYGVDLLKNTYAKVKLKEEAERCKKELSTKPSCHILVPMIIKKEGKPLALDETITSEQFEEMSKNLMERTHRPIDIVLADSGILPDKIDQVILVGGSIRMPFVAKDIRDYLKLEPAQAVNPDYAVAEGAAIQAGIIQGVIRQEESIVIIDVNPYTLRIRIMDEMTDDRMSVMIPRNATIPITRSQIYYTSWNYQTEAHIEVYQGESSIASSNHFLGDFIISGIPAKRAGKERIGVEFAYNINGMLEVKPFIVNIGKDAALKIDMMKEQKREEEEIDVSRWKEAPGSGEFRTIIRRAEWTQKNSRQQGEIFLAKEIEDILDCLKRALITGNQEAAKEAEEELLDLLDEI